MKLAYYALAKTYHPDRNASPTAIAKMQLLNRAYARYLQSTAT